jgi:NADH dehydrogenase [ubiquinone] 1 alpha subcomplex assembly factor 7
MDDMLRVRVIVKSFARLILSLIPPRQALSKFPEMYDTLQGVQLVEASPGLRKMQRASLVPGSQESDVIQFEDERSVPVQRCTRPDGLHVNWYDGIEDLPDSWSMIMAHEFFDALPIHTFEVKVMLRPYDIFDLR